MNTELEQKLSTAIRIAIDDYKEQGGDNHHAFSVNARFEEGGFLAECDFDRNHTMTIMYEEDAALEVTKLFENTEDSDEILSHLAGIMFEYNFVDDWPEVPA